MSNVNFSELPYYEIWNAPSSCENWNQFSNDQKMKTASYWFRLAPKDDPSNSKTTETAMKCSLNDKGRPVFEMSDEHAKIYMKVVNPEIVNG